MSFKDLKITTYQDSVSALPDYPSDAGITAAQLKAVFDGRTDKEIKEKFNALIDELITKFGLVEVDIADAVEGHNQQEDAHEKIIAPIQERIAEIIGEIISLEETDEEIQNALEALDMIISGKADASELNKKVDKVTGKGLSSNDFTDEDKQMIQDAYDLGVLFETHYHDFTNPHAVTAGQVGAYTKTEADEKFVGSEEYDGDWKYLDGAITINSDRIDQLAENVGDIDTALDSILAIQNELIGG